MDVIREIRQVSVCLEGVRERESERVSELVSQRVSECIRERMLSKWVCE